MRPYTDQEWESLPHIVMTSDVDWDPALLDGEFPLTGQEPHLDTSTYHNGTPFDIHGDYTKGTLVASARRVHDDEAAALTTEPETTHVAVVPDFPVPDDDMDTSSIKHPPSMLPPPEPPPIGDAALTFTNVSPHLTPASLEPEQLRKFFAFLPTEVVARTLAATTQYARVPVHDVMRRFY